MSENHSDRKKIYLIDASSYVFRAFHALPYLSTSRGIPTNAILGFTNMLLRLLKEEKPPYWVAIFDARGPTFRDSIWVEYKANRPPMADDLVIQLPYIKGIVQAMRIPCVEVPGYEADDVIGTMSKELEQMGFEVFIVSGDKDMYQLVTERVRVLDTMKGRVIGIKEVIEKFGVEPEKIPDVMALAGDSIDNIPGVPGIGEKGASELVKRFGSLEEIYENLNEIGSEKRRSSLLQFKDQAMMSKRLAIIDRSVPLKIDPEKFRYKEGDIVLMRKIFKELEFYRILRDLPVLERVKPTVIEVVDEEGLEDLKERIIKKGLVSIVLENTYRETSGGIGSISLCTDEKEVFFIPVMIKTNSSLSQRFMETIRGIIEDQRVSKIGVCLKSLLRVLLRNGICPQNVCFDPEIASYLLNPSRHSHRLEDIVDEYLSFSIIKELQPLSSEEELKQFLCERALSGYLLYKKLYPCLEEAGTVDLYRNLELPLTEVLAWMEEWGVKIDTQRLKELSREYERRILKLEEEIFRIAGKRFNVNSPQQLRTIMFDELKLPHIKRTKTGQSTDSEVLMALSPLHPLPSLVLEHRILTKLKTTYIDVLPKMVNPRTGRLHTSFNQIVTATGRLSSSEPNLQNIPIKGEEGKRIREAFVPDEGCVFLSADYSQIELRILAHISGDEKLSDAFKKDEDIHRSTAAEIFGIEPGDVNQDMRRKAKMINYGIIYGISPHGLASGLGIDEAVAEEYIKMYLARYPGVKSYMENIIKMAEKNGYVETLFKRRRYIPEIKSKIRSVRSSGERIAINTPIQGTAADIIKKAMVDIFKEIRSRGLRTKMVLQVHDELLFEVPSAELELIRSIVKERMEGAASLSVPLKVDLKIGKNWAEAHD